MAEDIMRRKRSAAAPVEFELPELPATTAKPARAFKSVAEHFLSVEEPQGDQACQCGRELPHALVDDLDGHRCDCGADYQTHGEIFTRRIRRKPCTVDGAPAVGRITGAGSVSVLIDNRVSLVESSRVEWAS